MVRLQLILELLTDSFLQATALPSDAATFMVTLLASWMIWMVMFIGLAVLIRKELLV